MALPEPATCSFTGTSVLDVSGAHPSRGLPLVEALWEAFGLGKLTVHLSSSCCPLPPLPGAAGFLSFLLGFRFVSSLSGNEVQVWGEVTAEGQPQTWKSPELCEGGAEQGGGPTLGRV